MDDSAGNGQADAASSGRPGACPVGPEEPFEDVLEVLGGDALAGVDDGKLDLAVSPACAGLDASARWCVAKRVVEEVGKDRAESIGIDFDLGEVWLDGGLERDALCGESRERGMHRGLDDHPGTGTHEVEFELVLLGSGDHRQVLDEPMHPVGLAREHLPRLGGRRDRAVGEALDVSLQRREGRAELMRDIREQCPPPPFA